MVPILTIYVYRNKVSLPVIRGILIASLLSWLTASVAGGLASTHHIGGPNRWIDEIEGIGEKNREVRLR
jgi:DMSO reductase anchor subunit